MLKNISPLTALNPSSISIDVLFRHEKFRKHQDKLIEDVQKALEEKATLLAHAPTGLGKTDAVISPALKHAVNTGKVVLFLTPKISQHAIALDVVRGINEKHGMALKAVDIIGRRYSCIHPSLSGLDQDSFYTLCEHFRKEELCPFHRNAVGYTKEESVAADGFVKEALKRFSAPSYKDMMEFGKEYNLCPYELMLKAAKDAHLIIADYYHFFIPSVRDVLLKKLHRRIDELIVIVDEAHNLPNRITSYLSRSVNLFMLKALDRELEMVGGDKLKLNKALEEIASIYLKGKESRKGEEVLVPKHVLDLFLREGERTDDLLTYLYEAGESYVEATNKPSIAIKVAKFIEQWQEDGADVIRVLKKTQRTIALSRKSLDPSLLTDILNNVDSAVLMSGTLTPLEMYVDILGIKKPITRMYQSPFPPENKLNIIVKGLTSRYVKRTEEMFEAYAKKITELYYASPGGVVVFFPSFEFLERTRKYIDVTPLLIQKPSASPTENVELINNFRRGKGLLLGVQGGSLSEGVNLAKGEIKVLIIAGLALNDMTLETKALIDYYEKKFKKGWDYAYIYPAITKALQAAGRAIRKENDKAAIIYMDDRFTWSNYFKLLPTERYISTYDPEKHVKEFFRK